MPWRLAVFALVVAGIWWPQFAHYWVPTPPLAREVVQAARTVPNDATLARFAMVSFEPAPAAPARNLTAEAEQILRGVWDEPGFASRPVHLPFDERDLTYGWPTEQLKFASLEYVDVLLSAYESSNDPRFLTMARDVINGWSIYESHALLPSGYVWNDHAVAQRVLVLGKYWRLIRHLPLADSRSAALLLRLVARSGRLLMRPDQYTVRTNHGLMEGLALLDISIFFPTLPDSAAFRQAALERLRTQLNFYQSDEGVVLEHSVGYHVLGIHLLTMLARYAEEVDPALRSELRERLAKACRFLNDVKRPDGSVPLIGDTSADEDTSICVASPLGAERDAGRGAEPSGPELSMYPVSGYGIVWYGRRAPSGTESSSQTVVAWGNFATRAHKHDDELSVYTWHSGLPILTGSGYWPYGARLEKAANSWRGADAPFLAREPRAEDRVSSLVGIGHTASLAFLDLVRDEQQSGASVRRQIVTIGPSRWIVIDSPQTRTPQPLTIVWTLYPGWSIARSLANESLEFHHARTGERLAASFASTAALSVQPLTESERPFGGWISTGPSPLGISGATSLEVRAPSGVPVLSDWSFGATGQDTPIVLQRWNGPTDWSACLDGRACTKRLARLAMQLSLTSSATPETMAISQPPSQAAAVAAINGRYRAMSRDFPYWRDFYPWRVRVSLAITVLFLAQELAFAFLSGRPLSILRAPRRVLVTIHYACTMGWVFVGSWLVFHYFRS